MDGRHYYNSLRRLRLFASEGELTPDKASNLLQPFVDQWRPLKVPNKKDGFSPMDPDLQLSAPAVLDLSARIRAIGMNLNKSGLRGIQYHNSFQRHLAALAATFDCRGWTESEASFDDPDTLGNPTSDLPSLQLTGRVDVIWGRQRIPVAVFEIDSTVKPRSFQKLKEAASPHKFWIYFGKDVWGFKTFLQKTDPLREVTPVIVPRTFVPSFEEEADQ